MRKPPAFWDRTWARLGFVRRKNRGEAKHRKSRRLNMEALEARQYLTGIPPTIGSLTANLATVTRPDDFVLTANTVQDSDGTVQSVAFYRDSNGNAQLDVGTDELLGTDTSSDGGWTATVDTANFPAGAQTYFARATDNESLTSSPVWAANTVQGPFLIGAASVNEGSTYTLGLDPGGVSITGWSINWGDGGDAESVSGSAHSATHVYTDGTNNFSITATANSGTYTTNTLAVAVQNVAPYLSISGAASVNEGSSYTLNLSSSDPGADTIDHWTINWGDGGSPETVSGNPSSVTHTYADNAVRSVTATATDEDGTFSLGGTAGALDPVFGDGGKVTTNIAESGGGSETGKSVAIQSNGKIVMAGEGYLARYNTDGSLDSTFGVDGKLATGANTMALVLQSDDKILVASGKTVGQETTYHLARYFSDGTFDPSFGTGREIVLDFFPNALAVQSDGEILVAGYKTISTSDFVLTRYHSNGNLDAAFGTHGQVTTDFAGRSDYATAITVQSNGRIVVAGYSRSGSNNDFALARYTTDGGLDTTFGTGGKVTTDFAGRNDYGRAVSLQSDGKIVIGGYVYNGSNFDFALARYTTDGGLDTTFGTGGKVTTNFAGRDDYGFALGLQSDGKIVVGGYVFNGSNNDFALARYTTSGSLDTTFGTGGKVTTNIASQDNPAYSLAIQSDDKIVVGGYVGSTAAYDFALARYTAAGGSLDTSFDTDGIVTTDLGGSEDSARDVVVQSDGKVVLAGYVFNGSDYDFALTRYNTDGSLDTTFDGDGKVITDFGGSDYARSLAIQADGKIVVAGSSGSSFALARYNTDGSLDTSFDGDGKLTTAFASSAGGNTVAIDGNGKIVVGGGADSSFALARYNTDGSLDTTFDGDGKVTTAFTNGAAGTAVAIQSDGKIVLAGNAADTTVRFAVARYNTDGSLDTTFGTGGKVTTEFEGSYADGAYMVAVQADGRIVVGGTTYFFGMDFGYSDFAMARFNADGSLDSTFDGDGKLVTDIRVIDEAKAAVLQRDGKIVVVGYSELDPELPPVFDVVRYNVDGSLDTTFAGEGLRVADLEGSCYSVALAPDGRIVVAGESQQDFAAIRYLPGVVPLTVSVTNVAPTALDLDLTRATMSEGGQTVLSGTFTDPGTQDTHTVVIQWGDGSDNTTLNLAAGVCEFTAPEHYFRTAGNPTITVTVTDKDSGSTTENTGVTITSSAVTLYWDPDQDSQNNYTTGAGLGGSGTWDAPGVWSDASGNRYVWAGTQHAAVLAGTAGTVTISSGATVSPTSLTFAAAGYTVQGGTISLATGTLTTGGTQIQVATGTATVSTVLSGGKLSKTGSGSLVLGDNNTYTGGTEVSAGTLSVNTISDSGANALGTTGQIFVHDSTLRYSGTAAASTTRYYNGSGGGGDYWGTTTIDVTNQAGSLTLVGGYAYNQTLTKTGSGALILSGQNPLGFGHATVGAGTLVLAIKSTVPAWYNAVESVDAVEAGATLKLDKYSDGNYYDGQVLAIADTSRHIHLTGGTLDLNGDNVNRLPIVYGSGSVINSAAGTTAVLTVLVNDTQTFTGNIQDGTGTVALRAGTLPHTFAPPSGTIWTLSGNNTYTGGTVIGGSGTVTLGSATALPAATVVQMGDTTSGPGVLDLNGYSVTVAGLFSAAANGAHTPAFDQVTNSLGGTPATLTVVNSTDYTYAGAFAGNLALAKYGPGKWTLTGSGLNSGAATAYAGTLDIEGCYLGPATAASGSALLIGKVDPQFWVVSKTATHGEAGYTITDHLTVPTTPQKVWARTWQEAVYNAVSGYVHVNDTGVDINFAQGWNISGGASNSTDIGFRVGTVQELSNLINGRLGYDPAHPDGRKWDVFNLDDKNPNGSFQYASSDIVSEDTRLIVVEDMTGHTGNDHDYDDDFWVLKVSLASPASNYVPPSTCTCVCVCACQSGGGTNPGAPPLLAAVTGAARVALPGLLGSAVSPVLAAALATYNSFAADPEWGNGWGWSNASLPTLYETDTGVSVAFDATNAIWFSGDDPHGYQAQFGSQETLTHDLVNDLFLMTEPDGSVYKFNDLSLSNAGAFVSMTAPGGTTAVVTSRDAENRPLVVDYSLSPGGAVYQEIQYHYLSGGDPNAGQTDYVTLLTLRGGTLTAAEQVHYVYYASNGANGRIGDLKTATVAYAAVASPTPGSPTGWTSDTAGATTYFRYYTGTTLDVNNMPIGFEHGIKRVLLPEAYAAASAFFASAGVSNLDDVLEDTPYTVGTVSHKIDDFTCHYFEYDGNFRVTKETVYGETGSWDFATALSTTPDTDFNHWYRKTVTTEPNGAVSTVYYNYIGQTLLADLFDGTTHTVSYNHYDAAGRLDYAAQPSAIDTSQVTNGEHGYDSTQPDLGVQLFTGTGLINVYRYYPASPTTPASVFRDGDTLPADADDPGGGGVPGYLQAAGVRHGSAGTILWQTSVDYIGYTVHYGTANATTAYYVFNSSVYAAEDHTGDTAPVPLPGSDAAMTAYRYTFQADATGVGPTIAGQTTILPTVTAAQNGPDASADTADWYNAEGQLKWQRDERGYLTYYAYDSLGNLVATIENVNSGDGLTLPGGWSLPAVANGPSVHRQYDYDSTGRVTRTRGPAFTDDQGRSVCTVTWTQYDDAHQEAFSALGYFNNGDSTYTLVNPLSVTKYNANGQMTDEIGLAWDGLGTSPLNISGLLSIPATWAEDSHYVRKAWTSYQYSHTHLASTRVYFSIPTSGDGTVGVHYDQTDYGYENDGQGWMGRRNKAVSPGGTITRVVYDARGNVLETWVGTNDSDATDGDPGYRGPLQNNSNNMVRVSSATYDADGNVLTSTEYVGGSAPNRTTTYGYDWQDRPWWTLVDDGTYQRYALNTYDNLGRTTGTETYLDIDENLATIGPEPYASGSSTEDKLLSKTTTEYDNLGRVYRSSVYSVDVDQSRPAPGAALSSNVWYDVAGNVIKSQGLDSATEINAFTKTVYDGLGRPTVQYTGYDATPEPIGTSGGYAEASVITNDTILQQVGYQYDAASNVIFVTTWQRKAGDETTLGDLANATSPNTPRITYAGYWQDGLGRETVAADYGTLGPSGDRPAAAPGTTNGDGALVAITAYDTAGQVWQTTDAAGHVTQTTYDAAGRVLKTIENFSGTGIYNSTYPDRNITTTLVYNADGNVASVTDTLGNETTYAFDGWGRLWRRTDPDPDPGISGDVPVTEYAYNFQGEITSVTDPLGKATTYDYDQLGRQVSVVGPVPGLGETAPATCTVYDVRGNVYTVTDALSNQTTYVYDAWDRLATETDANGHSTHYSYWDSGAMHTLTDAESNTTTWDYDPLGRVVRETNELEQERNYTYSGGLLVQVVDRNERVLRYDYNRFARQEHEYWYANLLAAPTDPTLNTGDPEYTYSYNSLGQLVGASGEGTSYGYTLDDLGRATEITQTTAGMPGVHFDQTFDGNGNRTALAATINSAADFVNDYLYDHLGRMTDVQQHSATGLSNVAAKAVHFSYDAASQFATIARYADTAKTLLVATGQYTFDAAGRLRDLVYTGESSLNTLAGYHWDFDGANRITDFYSLADMDSGTPAVYATWAHAAYTNDATGQLLGADYTNWKPSSGLTDEGYDYDDNGNREDLGYSTPASGDNRMATGAGYSYRYDDEGNRIARWKPADPQNPDSEPGTGDTDVTTYTWDHRNRLTEVRHCQNFGGTADLVVAYTYDFANRWLGETVTEGETVTQRRYVYDGYQIVLEFEKLGTGDVTASNLAHRDLWGPAVDQLLAQESTLPLGEGQGEGYDLTQPGDVRWALTDNLNTVRDLATYSGDPGSTSVTEHRVFDSFGLRTSPAAVDCIFGYTGRAMSAATGLQNNLNRWYEAITHQWLGQDPTGLAPDVNPYRYCGNGPVNSIDPRGLAHLPSPERGAWIEGTPGNGVFKFSDTPRNQAAGVAGTKVRFADNCIGVGGFPAKVYYGGGAGTATVEIDVVKGSKVDFTAADAQMRKTLKDPNWQRPTDYTWNHAGGAGSKKMELVKKPFHAAVHHEGSASAPRAAARAGAGSLATATRGMSRALAIGQVYMTARDALQAAGIAKPDYIVAKGDYYFVAPDNSVFVVQLPPALLGLGSVFWDPKRVYVAGPRKGQTEIITWTDSAEHDKQAEETYGKLIPGSLFTDPKFIPGTKRKSLPILGPNGGVIGSVDENGRQYNYRYRNCPSLGYNEEI